MEDRRREADIEETVAERREEATSKESLAQQRKEDSPSSASEPSSGSSLPSPDGAVDDSTDELRTNIENPARS